jgi:hypothetical protein
MSKVIISQWDGGHAEDPRTFATNESQSSVNFDIATNPHKLIPYSDPVAETSEGAMTDDQITDVAVLNVSGTATIYGMGRASSASQDVAIFVKGSTSDITSAWSQVATNGNDLTPGTLTEYKDKLYFIAGGSTFSSFTAPTTYTGIASLSGPYTTNFSPKIFRHPIDDTLYYASANKVYKYDAVTYTTALDVVHTLATNFEIQSFTDWGNYLAIGGKYLTKHKRSAVYLSNRVIPNDGTQAVIDWGEGSLAILENIQGSLVGISYTENVGSYTSQNIYKLFIKVYNGGQPVTVKEIVTSSAEKIRIWKAKSGDKLYFGYDMDNAMFVLGKNKNGNWYVCKNRYYNPGGSFIAGASGRLTGLSIVGDITFTSYGDATTDGYLARQGTGTAYTLPSQYTTTINPKMAAEDRTKKKELKSVRIAYTAGAANANVKVYVYKDGGSSALALDMTETAAGEYVAHSDHFADGTQFDQAYEFQFLLQTTGNASIKQFEYEYEPVND